METSQIQFKDHELKQVIFAAVLMSSIDKDIHEKEWEIIESFGESHWKQGYGDFGALQQSLLAEVRELLTDETSLHERIESLVTGFKMQYSPEQKSVIIDLLGNIIEADDVLDSNETNLFGTFLERLSE